MTPTHSPTRRAAGAATRDADAATRPASPDAAPCAARYSHGCSLTAGACSQHEQAMTGDLVTTPSVYSVSDYLTENGWVLVQTDRMGWWECEYSDFAELLHPEFKVSLRLFSKAGRSVRCELRSDRKWFGSWEIDMKSQFERVNLRVAMLCE